MQDHSRNLSPSCSLPCGGFLRAVFPEPARREVDVVELVAPLLGGLVDRPQSPVQVIHEEELPYLVQQVRRLRAQRTSVVVVVVRVGGRARQLPGRSDVMQAEIHLPLGAGEARVVGEAVLLGAGPAGVLVPVIGDVEGGVVGPAVFEVDQLDLPGLYMSHYVRG